MRKIILLLPPFLAKKHAGLPVSGYWPFFCVNCNTGECYLDIMKKWYKKRSHRANATSGLLSTGWAILGKAGDSSILGITQYVWVELFS